MKAIDGRKRGWEHAVHGLLFVGLTSCGSSSAPAGAPAGDASVRSAPAGGAPASLAKPGPAVPSAVASVVSGAPTVATTATASASAIGNTISDAPPPPEDTTEGTAAFVTLGGGNACVRSINGRWSCWGENTFSQVGDAKVSTPCGTPNQPQACITKPTPLATAAGATSIALSWSFACMLGKDRRVSCWGSDHGNGSLGRGKSKLGECPLKPSKSRSGTLNTETGEIKMDGPVVEHRATMILCDRQPAPIQGLTDVTQISVGTSYACARTGKGAVYCWGSGHADTLGVSSDALEACKSDPCSRAPRLVDGLQDVVHLSSGSFASSATLKDGRVMTWGQRVGNQLGRASGGLLAAVPELQSMRDVSMGSMGSCALDASGQVLCWGGVRRPAKPTAVQGLTDVEAIATGSASHTCAIRKGGRLYCWGSNESGQLGVGDTQERTEPTEVTWLRGVTQVAVGDLATCAVTARHQLYCWGGNDRAQLGGARTNAVCKLPYIADSSKVGCATRPQRVPEGTGGF